MKIGEIRTKSTDELRTHVAKIREEHYSLRFRRVTDVIENPRQLRELRKDIARIQTVIRERDLGLPQAGAEAKAPATAAPKPAAKAAPAAPAKESAAKAAAAKPAKAKAPPSRSARKPVKATRARAAKPSKKAAPKAAKGKKTSRKSK